MKKIWKSKGTIIGLAAVCILIAGTCLIVRMKKDGGSFDPGRPPDETVSEWEEADSPNQEEKKPDSSTDWKEQETLPQKETENRDEVVIEFTTEPMQPETPEAPEAPEPQGELTDPSSPPTYTEEVEVQPEGRLPETTESLPQEAPPETQTEASAEQPSTVQEEPAQDQPESTPQMDGVREDGAVYDPVFGWVVPSPIIQSEITSDGDPNKMVGHMD